MSRLVCITCNVGTKESSIKIKEWNNIDVNGKINSYVIKYNRSLSESTIWEDDYDAINDGPRHNMSLIRRSINERSCIIDNDLKTDKYILFRDPDVVCASIYCREEDTDVYKQLLVNQIKEYLTRSVFNYTDTLNVLNGLQK